MRRNGETRGGVDERWATLATCALAAGKPQLTSLLGRQPLASPLISSSLLEMGVPVTTQACRRQSEDAMTAATDEELATSCASSSTTLIVG